ncbi:MAG: hypothetical protein QOD50_399 [Actinomycetota bacterium]|nr:hypothetical protein [Actinomycetota bacterium]
MSTYDPEFFAPPLPDLLRLPSHRVIGVLPTPDEATASVLQLSEAGFAREEIHAICGEEGVRRLDPSGKHHGLHGLLIRAVENVASADDSLFDYADELAAGAVIVSVPAGDDETQSRAAHVLREHGATKMRYFGTATITELG